MQPVDQTITWSLERGVVDDAAIRGINIAGTPQYCTQVITALNTIAGYRSGRQLIKLLIRLIQTPRDIPLTLKIVTNPAMSSQCRAGGWQFARTTLSSTMATYEWGQVGQVIREAIVRCGHDYTWFADQLCSIPDYSLVGPVAVGRSNVNVTDLHVLSWCHNVAAFPLPFAGDDALILRNSVKILLWRMGQTRPGSGARCAVIWNPGPTITLTNGVVQPRPEWIGLAHELTHAYYSMSGTQLQEQEHSDLDRERLDMLGEYMCVGLGPWDTAPISENRIRTEAGVPLRPMY